MAVRVHGRGACALCQGNNKAEILELERAKLFTANNLIDECSELPREGLDFDSSVRWFQINWQNVHTNICQSWGYPLLTPAKIAVLDYAEFTCLCHATG